MYYKKLDEFIRRHHIEKRIYLSQNPDKKLRPSVFRGYLPVDAPIDPFLERMDISDNTNVYNKKIVNKWHLICFLNKNKSLCVLRKHTIIKEEEERKLGMIQKVKQKLTSCCLKKKNQAKDAEKNDDLNMTNLAEPSRFTMNTSNNSYLDDSFSSDESKNLSMLISNNRIGDVSLAKSFYYYPTTQFGNANESAPARNTANGRLNDSRYGVYELKTPFWLYESNE